MVRRAKAFVAAGDLFCSQFSEDQCAYPCQYDAGVGCQINGDSYYQVFDCPGSVVRLITCWSWGSWASKERDTMLTR